VTEGGQCFCAAALAAAAAAFAMEGERNQTSIIMDLCFEVGGDSLGILDRIPVLTQA
jgi:hypothetical protein